jgi:glycosyltransferase involved in cell wall biosynthesis
MRITYLAKRWDHHTTSGGYDQLATVAGATVVNRQKIATLPAKAIAKLWQRLTSTEGYLADYQFADFIAELKLLTISALARPDVVHVLYGDEQLNLLINLRRLLRCPLVASFHLPQQEPVTRRFEFLQPEAAKLLDAAVVVSKHEIPRFRKWFGPDKVVYIPHGIDTTRFVPDEGGTGTNGGPLQILVVGEHLRDWEVIHTVIDETNRRGLAARFDVVTAEKYFPYFVACANTSLYAKIKEPMLIEMYHKADAVLIPVTDATANNSILEALACGTPVISTQVGGIPDYVSDRCGWLFPKGATMPILDLMTSICANREIARSKRADARRRAMEFSWPRIVEMMLAVYAAIIAGRSPATALPHAEEDLL